MNGKKAAAETPRYYHTDHRGMTILYEAYGNLYINLTNRCPCACEFCERKLFDHIGSNGTLWLSHEPTAEEVKAALDQKDLSRYGEVVFCGFGEPTEALPVLLETADELKRRGAGNVRINTNGLGNLVNRRDITPEFDYYSPVIISNTNWLSENPDTAKAFLRAVAKGYEYAIADPDSAAEILCRQVPELDAELVKESQNWLADQYKAEVSQWGYIDQARWDAFFTWLSENELSDEIPAGFGFTNEYLPE